MCWPSVAHPHFVFQLNRQLGGSMPNCASNSACSSRRSSRGSAVSAGNYGCYSPAGVSMGSTSRRSSGGGIGSRRDSAYFVNPHMEVAAACMSPEAAASVGFGHQSQMSGASSPLATSGLGNQQQQQQAGQNGPGMSVTTSNLLQSLGSGMVGAASYAFSTTSASTSSLTPPRYKKTFLSRHNFPM